MPHSHTVTTGVIALGRRGLRARIAVALATVLTVGCGGDEAVRLGDHLDQLDVDAPMESAATVSLGAFDVTAPATAKFAGPDGAPVVRSLRVRVKFDLYAEVAIEDLAAVEAAAEQRRGALHDTLLTIIRSSSMDELSDPRLTSLKMRMTESARPLLGDRQLRQLILDRSTTEIL